MQEVTYISLVDDHILLRSALATLINSMPGYKVIVEAANGRDFIGQLKPKSAPDIVLLDITMPVMNGYETAEWIRVNLPETKVVVLSMMDNDASIIRMIKLGAKGYILKDCKPAVLQDALNQVRDHGIFLNELVSNRMLKYLQGSDPAEKSGYETRLTPREMEFLKWACSEMTYKEIAAEMFVSPRTVESYRDSLLEKLELKSRVGLVMYAIRNGIAKI